MGRILPMGLWYQYQGRGAQLYCSLLKPRASKVHRDEPREIIYENSRLQVVSEDKPHRERAVDGKFRCAASLDERAIPQGFRWIINCQVRSCKKKVSDHRSTELHGLRRRQQRSFHRGLSARSAVTIPQAGVTNC
jgi:hypothetical protein